MVAKPSITLLMNTGEKFEDLYIYVNDKYVTKYTCCCDVEERDDIDLPFRALLSELGFKVKVGKYRKDEDDVGERAPTTVKNDIDGELES